MNCYSTSIVVPTYMRPDYLDRCVRSIFAQSKLPDEIILVSRDSDELTNRKIHTLQREFSAQIPIINPQVSEPGFLPPLLKGMSVAVKDIVIFFDDDAEAFPDWLERMLTHYNQPEVAGVGGRCITYYEGKLLQFSASDRASVITWYGEAIGNMYRNLTFDHAVSASHLMGGNSSYRREVLQSVGIDPYLNKDVAFGWELDLGLSIQKAGYSLVFDPMVKINHYTAPRKEAGMRPGHSYESLYYMARNNVYTMTKHLPLGKRIVFLAYTFLVGRRSNLGIASFLVCLLGSFDKSLFPKFSATIKGKWIGWRDATKARNKICESRCWI